MPLRDFSVNLWLCLGPVQATCAYLFFLKPVGLGLQRIGPATRNSSLTCRFRLPVVAEVDTHYHFIMQVTGDVDFGLVSAQ